MFFHTLSSRSVALDFFEKRRNAEVGINGDKLDKKNMVHPV